MSAWIKSTSVMLGLVFAATLLWAADTSELKELLTRIDATLDANSTDYSREDMIRIKNYLSGPGSGRVALGRRLQSLQLPV